MTYHLCSAVDKAYVFEKDDSDTKMLNMMEAYWWSLITMTTVSENSWIKKYVSSEILSRNQEAKIHVYILLKSKIFFELIYQIDAFLIYDLALFSFYNKRLFMNFSFNFITKSFFPLCYELLLVMKNVAWNTELKRQ